MNHTAPLAIDTFLPYMRDVVRCEQSLRELNLMWRMIEASAKMNCPSEARTILPTVLNLTEVQRLAGISYEEATSLMGEAA